MGVVAPHRATHANSTLAGNFPSQIKMGDENKAWSFLSYHHHRTPYRHAHILGSNHLHWVSVAPSLQLRKKPTSKMQGPSPERGVLAFAKVKLEKSEISHF